MVINWKFSMDMYLTDTILSLVLVISHLPQMIVALKFKSDDEVLKYGPYGSYGWLFVFFLLLFWIFVS